MIDIGELKATIKVNGGEAAAKSFKTLQDKVEKTGEAIKKFAIVSGAVLGASLVKAVSSADKLQQACNKLQSQTGATNEEMKGLHDTLESIYANNYGDSYEDIADAMAIIHQQTGLTGDKLQKATENALALRDTFDWDVNDTIRAVNSLMGEFNISMDEAYNLLAQGAQNGLDKNRNLLDTISEYAPHFREMGFTAEGFLNTLHNGCEAGVFDLDKIGDGIKEFNIRAKDGSNSTKEALTALHLDADKLTQAFAEGGPKAQDAYKLVMITLANCEDKVLQNQIGVALFGSLWEDMGAKAVLSLKNTNNTMDMTKNTMESIKEIRYDSLGEALSGIGRQIEVGILIPIGEKILPKLNEFANWFSENMPNISEAIKSGDVEGLMNTIGDMLSKGLLKLNEYMPQFVSGAIQLLQSFGQAVIENLPTILETLVQLGGTLLQAFIDLIPQLITMGGELIKSLADGIASNPTAIIDSVSNIIQSLGDALSSAMPVVLEAGGTILSSLIQGIGETMPQLVTTGLDMITNLIDGIINNLDTIIDAGLQLIEGLVDGVEQALPKLIEKAPELIGKLADKILDNLPKIVDTATKIVVKLATALIQNAPKLLQSAQTLVITLVNSLISHLPQIIETGFKMVGELAAGIIKNIPAIIKGVTQITTNIKNPLAKIDLLTIGKQLIQGLINGIKSMATSVGGAITSLCNDAVKAAKDALGIHSPSRVMMEVGGYTVEGFVNGLDEKKKDVSEKAKEVAEQVKGGLDNLSDDVKNLSYSQLYEVTDMLEKVEDKYKNNAEAVKDIQETLNDTIKLQLEKLNETYDSSNEKQYESKCNALLKMKETYSEYTEIVTEIEKELTETIEQEFKRREENLSETISRCKNTINEVYSLQTENLDKESQARIDALQAEIDAIDAEKEAKALAEKEASLKQAILQAETDEQRKQAEESYNEWKIEQYKKSLKEQIELEKLNLEEKKELLKSEQDETQKLLEYQQELEKEKLEVKKKNQQLSDSEVDKIAKENIEKRHQEEIDSVNENLQKLIDNADSYRSLGEKQAEMYLEGLESQRNQIQSFWDNLGSGKINGSHRNGLVNVPFDGYRAELHKGEMVLTQAQADRYRNQQQPTIINNTFDTSSLESKLDSCINAINRIPKQQKLNANMA